MVFHGVLEKEPLLCFKSLAICFHKHYSMSLNSLASEVKISNKTKTILSDFPAQKNPAQRLDPHTSIHTLMRHLFLPSALL